MVSDDLEAAIVGAGAAGIAAACRLRDAGVDCLLLEARRRLGGRAWTVVSPTGLPLDMGCGWLHSADRNPWRAIAEAQGRHIDFTSPPWLRPALPIGFPPSDQAAFRQAFEQFLERVISFPDSEPDCPASALLDPSSRWNGLIDAVATYMSGAELDWISARDHSRYADSGVNWRVVEGYGAVVAAYGASLRVALECPVRRIDHSGRRLKLETARGEVTADIVIITLPTNLIAEGLFSPALPEKVEAAMNLPLGFDDKLFLSLADADEFEPEGRLSPHIDRTRTAAYHVRPFGRPLIEAYFGGSLVQELEKGGKDAFFDFARTELTDLLGSGFAKRIKPIGIQCWGTDPYARGSYSHAVPGKADCRAVLAAPVDERLFFAGEACSTSDYSTAHGAYLTGIAAAEQALAVRRGRQLA
ncbi:MAG TPA: NAD(P)/FAD-dependent oxidoreductase [Gammaproteobacteria bacterium]|nr:NAD(P)/FAD-dependent oxidoreductase [Gammaproteobacteria bacterium]